MKMDADSKIVWAATSLYQYKAKKFHGFLYIVEKMFSESDFECIRSRYGCCSDNITAMGDEEGSNCPGKDCML